MGRHHRGAHHRHAAHPPPHGNATPPSPPPRPRITGWRKWVLRLALVVLAPALVLAAAEVALRVAGYGYPTRFFLGADDAGNHKINRRYGWQFFPREIARAPHPCVLPARKAPGTVRIFVLGSSAAMGAPEPSFGFPRILEVMLRERYPGVRFEVVNAAMTAINSHVALRIARDCAAFEPDLFIVYMGNNEVIGPFGPAAAFSRHLRHIELIRATLCVKSTRVGQLMGDALAGLGSREKPEREWRGMEMFVAGRVAADDLRLATVYSHFRTNLGDIAATARAAGAKTIVSTVATNLRDCPPFASVHRPDLAKDDLARWQTLHDAGAALEAAAKPDEAMASYAAAAKIDDRFADLHFRLGRCHWAAGRFAEARAAFVLARDLDALRFRADSQINAILRDVAREHEAEGVSFVDAEAALDGADPAVHGLPGRECFWEHVHLTFTGSYRLALAMLPKVEEALPEAVRRQADAARPVPSEEQCAAKLALTPWDLKKMAGSMAKMTARPPFLDQLDHAARQAEEERQLAELRRSLTPETLEQAAGAYRAALAQTPDDWMLHANFADLEHTRGRYDAAIEHCRAAIRQMPGVAALHVSLGNTLMVARKSDEAATSYQEALRLAPESAEAHKGLGDVLYMQRKFDEAVGQFQEAVRRKPCYVSAHNNLAGALMKLGRTDEAITHFAEAVRLEPEAAGYYNLANALVERGRTAEAVENYRKALSLNPSAEVTEMIRRRLAACEAKQTPRPAP